MLTHKNFLYTFFIVPFFAFSAAASTEETTAPSAEASPPPCFLVPIPKERVDSEWRRGELDKSSAEALAALFLKISDAKRISPEAIQVQREGVNTASYKITKIFSYQAKDFSYQVDNTTGYPLASVAASLRNGASALATFAAESNILVLRVEEPVVREFEGTTYILDSFVSFVDFHLAPCL